MERLLAQWDGICKSNYLLLFSDYITLCYSSNSSVRVTLTLHTLHTYISQDIIISW